MIFFWELLDFYVWKCADVQFQMVVPSSAYTPQALSTGRYPL